MVKGEIIMGEQIVVNSDKSLGTFMSRVAELHSSSGWVTYTWVTGKKRTNNQNAAMWKYFGHVAEGLNRIGMSCYISSPMFKSDIEVEWNKELVSQMWLTVQEAVAPGTGDSTRMCPKDKVSKIYDIINRKLIDLTNGQVNEQFPSILDYPEKASKNG